MKKHVLPLFCLLLLCNKTVSAEALSYNLVELQSSASAQIPNDTIGVNLFSELNDTDPQRLNRLLDKQFDEAIVVAKSFPAAKLQLSARQSYPVYGANNKLQSWRARLSLAVSGQDMSAVSQLVGKLQSQFQVADVNYSVSAAKRQTVEQSVTEAALHAFQSKAALVTKTLAPGKSYRLVNLQVGGDMGTPAPVRLQESRMNKAVLMAAEPAYDQVNTGESALTVVVSGSVQIQE